MEQEKISRDEMIAWFSASIKTYDVCIAGLEKSLSYTKHSKRRDRIKKGIRFNKAYRGIFEDALEELESETVE